MITKKQRRARQGRHALRRARERYGVEFGKASRRAAVKQIQDGDAEFVKRGTRKRFTVWLVVVRETKIKVVYDKNLKSITTVLPEDNDQDDD